MNNRISILLFILIVSILNITSVYASTNEKNNIHQAQKKLLEKGYTPGPIDGILGKRTAKAIRNFQRDHKLPLTGKLDRETKKVLGLQKEITIIKPSEKTVKSKNNVSQAKKIIQANNADQLVPLNLLLIILLIATIIIFIKKSHIENRKSLSYLICKYNLEFFVPLTIVLSFYYILLFIISLRSDFLTLYQLIYIETYFEKIKSYVSIVKLDAKHVLIIFAVIYLLNIFKIIHVRSDKFDKLFSKYQQAIRLAYIFIVFLTSFTFLGTQLGEPTNNFKFRIKTIRDGYAELRSEIQEIVSKKVTNGIYEKLPDRLPSSYTEALKLSEQIEQEIVLLNNEYANARKDYKLSNKVADNIIKSSAKREIAISELVNKSIEYKNKYKIRSYDALRSPEPKHLSVKKINKVKNEVESYKAKLASKAKPPSLFQTKAGKKLTPQILKTITSKGQELAFKALIKEYPILEPLVDVFTKTLDDKIQTKTEIAIDEITKKCFREPKSNIEHEIDTSVRNVVESANTEKYKVSSQKIGRLQSPLAKELKTVKRARTNIAWNVGRIQADLLIDKLSSSSEQVRIDAAKKLAKLGRKLSRAQVNKLVEIMNYGSKTWEHYVSERWEGSYCYKKFKTVSIRQYAAMALGEINSPHINYTVKREAKEFAERRTSQPRYVTRTYI